MHNRPSPRYYRVAWSENEYRAFKTVRHAANVNGMYCHVLRRYRRARALVLDVGFCVNGVDHSTPVRIRY